MYHDSPEKAAYNGEEQSEAGILKALLIGTQLRDGRALHRVRCIKSRGSI